MAYFDHTKSFSQRHRNLINIFVWGFGALGLLGGLGASIYLGVAFFPGLLITMSLMLFPGAFYYGGFSIVSMVVSAMVGYGLAALIGLAYDGGCLLLDEIVNCFENTVSEPPIEHSDAVVPQPEPSESREPIESEEDFNFYDFLFKPIDYVKKLINETQSPDSQPKLSK